MQEDDPERDPKDPPKSGSSPPVVAGTVASTSQAAAKVVDADATVEGKPLSLADAEGVPAAPSAATLVDAPVPGRPPADSQTVETALPVAPIADESAETLFDAVVERPVIDPPSDETEVVRVPLFREPAATAVEVKPVETTFVEATVVDAKVIVEATVVEATVVDAKVFEAEVVEAKVVEAKSVEAKVVVVEAKVVEAKVVEAEVVVEARAEIVDAIPEGAKRSDPPAGRRSSPSHTVDAPRIARSERPSSSQVTPTPGSAHSGIKRDADRPSSGRPPITMREGSRPSLPAIEQTPPLEYLRQVAPRPAAGLGLIVIVYCLIAYFAASRVSSERTRVNAGLVKVEELGQRATQEMLRVPVADLAPVLSACAGKLPRGSENSILSYAAGPTPELVGTLGPRGTELPAHEVIGSRDGEVDYVSVKDETHISTLEIWTDLLFSKPWHWDLAIDYRAQRGPATKTMKLLIVALVRDAMMPRLLTESTFDGGTSVQHVRVITTEGGLVCEGALHTRMVMLEVGKEQASKTKGDDILVIFGASPRAEAKYAAQVRYAPMKSQCFIAGDSTYCHSIERALAQ